MNKMSWLVGAMLGLIAGQALADELQNSEIARALGSARMTRQETVAVPSKGGPAAASLPSAAPVLPVVPVAGVRCEVQGGLIYKVEGNKVQPSKWLHSCGAFPKQAFRKEAVTACLRHRGYSEILFEDNTTIQVEENVSTGDLCQGKWDNTPYKAGAS
jgi:hypothetical protein